jgi:hypothetical protein
MYLEAMHHFDVQIFPQKGQAQFTLECSDMRSVFDILPLAVFAEVFPESVTSTHKGERLQLPPIRPEIQILELLNLLWTRYALNNQTVIACDTEPFHPKGCFAMVKPADVSTPPRIKIRQFIGDNLKWGPAPNSSWQAIVIAEIII